MRITPTVALLALVAVLVMIVMGAWPKGASIRTRGSWRADFRRVLRRMRRRDEEGGDRGHEER